LEQLHTLPSLSYLTKVRNLDPKLKAKNYMKYYPVYGDKELSSGQDDHGNGGDSNH
jgi:hypothetical protein